MTIWWKIGAVAVAAVAFFMGGYEYASALYEADIADLQAQHALTVKEKNDEYRSKEQLQAKQLAEAWNRLEQARAESVDLRADVDRVRKLADDYRKRLSSAGSDACQPCRERLASCTKLLEESAELCEEGARLFGEVAAKKDALARIHGAEIK